MATYITVPVQIPAGLVPDPLLAYVERGTSATGPWTRLGQAPLTAGRGYFYDNTAPLDTPVWYRYVYPQLGAEYVSPTVSGPLELESAGTVILSDPNRPWADIEFAFCGSAEALAAAVCGPAGAEFIWTRFDEEVRRADAGLFDRLDAETPADVYGRRKSYDSGARFLTKSLAAATRVYELFTVGGPLFLRAPAAYGVSDVYVQPGDLAKSHLTDRVDQRFPHRLWAFPYTVVDPVHAIQQGTVCANWCALTEAYPTFADLTATGDTWAAVATGVTVCP
ncbi:hypothetical protein GTY86_35530 [Streptomyces sp. SID5770]|uniref:hypothetical protein n=1 Tax=Streptomyces sp. SID5770 TaxID=2690308 RepID=UPI0013721EE8|nr:hypothetical protein [Streptomyces sp. SID5770]MZE53823.1 hypothetical protein [Streptomyces sp. SID5770]MZE56488.1 hypothetical protein [Streptomyces sp. SID5770]